MTKRKDRSAASRAGSYRVKESALAKDEAKRKRAPASPGGARGPRPRDDSERLAVMERELRRCERELKKRDADREALERYRSLVDRSFDLIYLHDFEGRILDANPSALTTLGYDFEELSSLNLKDVFEGEDLERARAAIETILETGEIMRPEEFRLKDIKGGTLHIEATSSILYRNGKPFAVQGIARNITARKKSERALKESEDKFSRAFHAIQVPMAISRLDDGTFLEVNRAFLELYGFSREEVIGTRALDLNLWKDIGDRERLVALLSRGETVRNVRVRYRTRYGHDLTGLFSAVQFAVGGVPCMLGSTIDITEMVRAGEELAASEEKFRRLFEGTAEAQVLMDGDLVLDCNEAALSLMGCASKASLAGQYLQEFTPEIQPDGEFSKVKGARFTAIALARTSVSFEWLHRRKDGSTFFAEVILTAIPFEGREILHAAIRDVTERRRLQNEIIGIVDVAQKRIGQDLHDGIGQELTGLSFLCGRLMKKLAARGLPEAEEAREMRDMVYDIIRRTRALSRELHPPTLVENDIMFTLEEFAVSTSSLFGIDCAFYRDRHTVISDPFVSTQIYYVVREAVNNAVRHGRATAIEIRLASDIERVVLTVRDNGSGMAAQAEGHRGLGLRIMAYRMESINGTFHIEGEGGVTVTCTLPARVLPGED